VILTPEFRPWVVPFEVTGDTIRRKTADGHQADVLGHNKASVHRGVSIPVAWNKQPQVRGTLIEQERV